MRLVLFIILWMFFLPVKVMAQDSYVVGDYLNTHSSVKMGVVFALENKGESGWRYEEVNANPYIGRQGIQVSVVILALPLKI